MSIAKTAVMPEAPTLLQEHALAGAPTLAADTLAAATIAADTAAPTNGRPSSIAPPSTAGRTTVLPRAQTTQANGSAGARGPQWVLEQRPRYETQRVLGMGGLGEVSLAKDNDIERTVAVKKLRADVSGEEAVLRFADEVRTVGRLEHPSIVPIHDVGVDDQQQYYFVMKYVEGETLESIIEKLAAGDPEYTRRYTPERRADICIDIMQAIEYAHSQGILHRDIKPANIMIGKHGEVMVMDWGIAKDIRRNDEPARALPALRLEEPKDERARIFKTTQGSLIGTPAYMSPEQARGQNETLDERSDIYSLAVLFHELFTLRHYLTGCATLASVLAAVVGLDQPTSEFYAHLGPSRFPVEYMHFFRRGMRKNPNERYQSVEEMMGEFEAIRGGYFRVQCMLTMVKRPTHAILHFIDGHPAATPFLFFGSGGIVLFSMAYTLWHIVMG